jgi:hypothetical protein
MEKRGGGVQVYCTLGMVWWIFMFSLRKVFTVEFCLVLGGIRLSGDWLCCGSYCVDPLS